jgi:hypothetical protein
MPEPLSDAYLKETQRIVTAVPKGPWEPVPNDYGIPDAVGPISYLECFEGDQTLVIEFVRHAREALPALIGEVARLKDQVRLLEQGNGGARHGR